MKQLQQIFTRVEEGMKFEGVTPNAFMQAEQPVTINTYEACVNFATNEKIEDNDIVDNKEVRDNIIKDAQNIEIAVEVLNKVGSLMLYPNGYATKEMVMKYFEINQNTLESCMSRNKDELIENGLIMLQGEELKNFKKYVIELNLSLEDALKREQNNTEVCDVHNARHKYPEINPKNNNGLLLFDRRVILNIAMLLRDNHVAKEIRKFILDITETPHYKDLVIQQLTNIVLGLLSDTKALRKEVADIKKTINKHNDDIDATQDAVLTMANKLNMV